MKDRPRIAAYVYPGWHPCPERDRHFPAGWTEWDLVYGCRPRFEGHEQPRQPLLGRYDDSDPIEVEKRVRMAVDHGIDALVYGFFWCRGKRVFQDAIDRGFLGSACGAEVPFAVMWANRMPRRILPVRKPDLPVIEDDRLVHTGIEDFIDLVKYVAQRYFARENYLRIGGKPYFSIYDSTFFVRELGPAAAAEALRRAREWLTANGFPGMHLAAVDPAPGFMESVAAIGFDSVTHYVLLPYWKGPLLQDFAATAAARAAEWAGTARLAGLPYSPSVSPGWDASPRAADFGTEKPRKYPWWPVVTGGEPRLFGEAVSRALDFASGPIPGTGWVFLASLNEWSEGHYIEPDTRHGTGWLEALQRAKLLAE